MLTKILFVICITCAGALVPGAGIVQAQELVSARVLAIEGQVEIHRQPDGQSRTQNIAFKVEDELRAGDTIITGKNGRLALGLSDGSQAVIAPKTTVIIQDLSQSPRILFNVIRGKTRVHIEKLGGQPNPYRVNTPTAVIAVRGTIFDVLVKEDETQVFLHEGRVTVSNPTASDKAVSLFAGQMTQILWRRPPNTPNAFRVGRNDRIFKLKRSHGTGGIQAMRPNNRATRANGRIAIFGPRPDFSRGGSLTDSGSKPDFGRGAPPPNGPKPNASSRGGGKRPW